VRENEYKSKIAKYQEKVDQ
jgi:hypothetical protein